MKLGTLHTAKERVHGMIAYLMCCMVVAGPSLSSVFCMIKTLLQMHTAFALTKNVQHHLLISFVNIDEMQPVYHSRLSRDSDPSWQTFFEGILPYLINSAK